MNRKKENRRVRETKKQLEQAKNARNAQDSKIEKEAIEIKNAHEITTLEDAPEWIIDNRYLWHGYRKNFSSFSTLMRSMFQKHNETMNVWTHMIGAIIFMVALTYLVFSFERTRAIYTDFRTDIENSKISQLLRESTSKISDAFKQIDLEQNIANIKTSLKNIHELQINLLEEAKSKFINQELVILETFNKNYDEFLTKVDGLYGDFHVGLGSLKEISAQNLQSFQSKFADYLDGHHISAFIKQTLNSHVEFFPVLVFIVSAILCLGISAVFHLFYVMNPRICKILQKLDYAGISILNFGSAYSMYYYYFYCDQTLYAVYSSVIGFACLLCFAVSLSDWIDRPEARAFKGIMYAVLGFSNLIPVGHIIYLGMQDELAPGALPLSCCFTGVVAMAALYLVGVGAYISRFPERYFPKIFDIWLNSHTVFHFFVLFAAVTHLSTLLCLYNMRQNFYCAGR